MFAVIAAVSAMNDHLDRRHDRDAHIWRPLSADLISPRAAALFAAACMIAALALSASLGWRACLPMLGGLACVGLYNLRLRRTPFSWLPLAIAFALVPPWVAEAVGRFDGYLWWALPVGALAGLTAHLAMKLPDYERDDVPGFQSLMHWMTIDYAVPMTWGFMGGFIVLAVASANFERLRIEWVGPPAAIAVVCTLAMMGVSFFGVSERKLVWQRWAVQPGDHWPGDRLAGLDCALRAFPNGRPAPVAAPCAPGPRAAPPARSPAPASAPSARISCTASGVAASSARRARSSRKRSLMAPASSALQSTQPMPALVHCS